MARAVASSRNASTAADSSSTTAGFSDRSILVATSISGIVTNGRTLLRLFGIATDDANSTRSAGNHTAVSASLCAFFK